ncbi:hypothetical protein QTP88_010573 [Uroleucon formosanum]
MTTLGHSDDPLHKFQNNYAKTMKIRKYNRMYWLANKYYYLTRSVYAILELSMESWPFEYVVLILGPETETVPKLTGFGKLGTETGPEPLNIFF